MLSVTIQVGTRVLAEYLPFTIHTRGLSDRVFTLRVPGHHIYLLSVIMQVCTRVTRRVYALYRTHAWSMSRFVATAYRNHHNIKYLALGITLDRGARIVWVFLLLTVCPRSWAFCPEWFALSIVMQTTTLASSSSNSSRSRSPKQNFHDDERNSNKAPGEPNKRKRQQVLHIAEPFRPRAQYCPLRP